jgi:hypothetical protein
MDARDRDYGLGAPGTATHPPTVEVVTELPGADTGTLVVERPRVDAEVKIHVQEAPGQHRRPSPGGSALNPSPNARSAASDATD